MATGVVERLAPSTATALGIVRAVVHGAFLLNVLFASFTDLGALPATVMRPTGAMQLVPWGLYDALLTPAGMLAFKALMVASLLLGALGVWAPVTAKSSAALVLFYEGLLRSFGHFNHDEMTAVYALVVLAFVPCGDGFALGRGRARGAARGWVYGYPVLLVRLLVAWTYFSAGLIKLRVAGLRYFDPDNLPALFVFHSLDNLHDTHYRLAFALTDYRAYAPPLAALVVLWELLFPLAVVSPRARWWVLGFGVFFHVSTVFTMNVFFPFHLALYLVFVNWDAAAGWVRGRRPEAGDP
ncbi:MAG TPA: hypothetical protein VN228_01520 [Pyrinomonadaceae bacterium]|nr:hypothetical protein [Pyrinomonadaceae bacterium]